MRLEDKPPPLFLQRRSRFSIGSSEKVARSRSKSFKAPPSPRLELGETSAWINGYGEALLLGTLVIGSSLLYILIFTKDPLLLHYAALVALSGPILSFFKFLNWLGLKYFRHNA